MNYYVADMHLFCKSQTQEGRLNFDNRPFRMRTPLSEISSTGEIEQSFRLD